MRIAALASVTVLLVAPLASADTPPTIWDLGKNPEAWKQRALHVQIERDIDVVSELSDDPQDIASLQTLLSVDHARTLMDEYTGPKDAWLRFDEAWILTKREEWARATPIFEQVAKELDGTTFAQEVWERLAEAYVRVEKTADEIHAYDEVLGRATSDSERLTPLLNQGEAYMRYGDADTAVRQFREVLRLSGMVPNANTIDMLAQWDLAVALDRSGSPREGLEAARTAVRMDRRCIAVVSGKAMFLSQPDPAITSYVVPPGLYSISEQNKTVYFIPKYERDWYMALGYEALALDESSAHKSASYFRDAETNMMNYVSEATLHGGDKWLDLGKKRLDAIRRRRAEAQKRVAP